MGEEQALLSTEILNMGVAGSGPYAGFPSFSVRVRRRMPDFLSSVNLKQVRLGHHYLVGRRFCLLTASVLLAIFGVEVGKRISWTSLEVTNVVVAAAGLSLITLLFFYLDLAPRSTFLVDFACYRPPKELKVRTHVYVDYHTSMQSVQGTNLS